MERMQKIGTLPLRSAAQVGPSRIGIGFEKLDRKVFEPEKAYDLVAATGVHYVRLQSGWQRTETEKGKYDFAWLDDIVDQIIARGMEPPVLRQRALHPHGEGILRRGGLRAHLH